MKMWFEFIAASIGMSLFAAAFMLITFGIPAIIVVWAVKQFLP